MKRWRLTKKSVHEFIVVLSGRSLVFMLFLTVVGTGFGAYIMAVAAFSPCPPLVDSPSGVAIIVRHDNYTM